MDKQIPPLATCSLEATIWGLGSPLRCSLLVYVQKEKRTQTLNLPVRRHGFQPHLPALVVTQLCGCPRACASSSVQGAVTCVLCCCGDLGSLHATLAVSQSLLFFKVFYATIRTRQYKYITLGKTVRQLQCSPSCKYLMRTYRWFQLKAGTR